MAYQFNKLYCMSLPTSAFILGVIIINIIKEGIIINIIKEGIIINIIKTLSK